MPDSNAHSSLAPGTPTTIGSYRLIEPLGSGGMSSVFRAMHTESGHEVALKILPRSLAKNPTMLQRFLREARSAESLFDPHIVEIFDRGTEDGRYYLVLEYVDGGDLHDRIRSQGPMPLHEAVDAIRSAALGLRHAAQKGLIHRDIKPANLLRTSDGRVKLTDLGLALQTADEDERVTRDGTTVGTVDYMAPEQARDSRATSARSDMYSLGCTFYYILTGQPPFPGGDVPEKLRRHAHEPPPDIRDLRPDAPEELADLVKRMMAKKPEKRFVDYDHLIDALNELPIASPDGPLTALIVEEDEEPALTALIDEDEEPVLTALVDEDDEEPALTALIDEDEPDQPNLTALIDDDDDGGYTLGPPDSSSREPGSTASSPTIPSVDDPVGKSRTRPDRGLADVDFSKLAELEGDDAAEPIARPARREPVPTIPSRTSETIPLVGGKQAPRLDEVDVDEAEAGPVVQPRPRPGPPPGPSPVVVVLRVALGILIVVFAGLGLSHLFSVLSSDRSPTEVVESNPPENPAQSQPTSVARGHAAGPRWVEPAEPKDESPPAPTFTEPEIEAVGLVGAEPAAARTSLSPIVIVQRSPSVVDREHAESLRRALDALVGTVEIDDDGPFHENDLRVHGKERLIRAGKGRRPVVVAHPRLRSARNRPALVALEGSSLTIEGIDLVVQASELSIDQSALFLLNGAHLTLRDCTITVDGETENPLAVVQIGLPGDPGPHKPSTVRLERTLIRGPSLTAVRVAEGPAQVTVSRSVSLSGTSPVISLAGGGEHERSVGLLGSLLASADGIVELAGSAAGPKAKPLSVHALGTTFARVEGSNPAGVVVVREPASGGPDGPGVLWTGDRNRFSGFDSKAPEETSKMRFVMLRNVDDIRAAWPDAEAQSESESRPWPAESQSGWTSPDELASRFPKLAGLLAPVAKPSPNLRAWSVGGFEPLPVDPVESSPAFSEGENTQILTLDVSGEVGSGDLGAFLTREVRPDVDRVQVRVIGHGWHPCSPVHLPEGVSLEIVVQSSASDPLIWRPQEGAEGEALIEVRNADLSVYGAVFERDARADL
ncbi:MAG TPA: protein kinase, partial [Isosphaeraceae bacterium]|nr:protein kinase [Isosphaeraceae bacterium]